MFMQDATFAKILLVALPEATPMREAESLQNDLRRAGIIPYAWIINQSLSALKHLKDPVLRKRAASEVEIINTIKDGSCLFIHAPIRQYAQNSNLIR